MRDAHDENLSILRLIRGAGGYFAGAFADDAARERCVAEGDTGYALTLDGDCELRRGRLR